MVCGVMIMATEIIVAIIAALGGLAGSAIGVYTSANLTNYRIEQLEKKVDKHNQLIERTYALETEVEVQGERIDEINRRIR